MEDICNTMPDSIIGDVHKYNWISSGMLSTLYQEYWYVKSSIVHQQWS